MNQVAFRRGRVSVDKRILFWLTAVGAKDGDLSGEQQFAYDRANNDLHVENGREQDLIEYILVCENGAWVDCAKCEVRIIRKSWSLHHADLSDHYSLIAEIYFSNLPGIVSAR